MRMRFEPDDEDAFFARRDELAGQFAAWVADHSVFGDPSDAGLLMDWRWGYGDGELDRWRVTDVAEFLFEWCPRKVSAPPEYSSDIPATVASFVEFLAHTGMRRGGDSPSAIRRYCEKNTAAFVREMGDPAKFGMAKSLFGSAGGMEPDADRSPEGISALLGRLPDSVTSPWDDDEDEDGEPLGPVRLPTDADRRASASAAPVLVAMRELATYCATPGRTLTAKGNLRLADARHLVDALRTGDDPTLGGVRTLTTAEELPGLSWMVELALAAGVVRRQRGNLVAVARFTELDDVGAHTRLAREVLENGVARRPHPYFPLIDEIEELVEGCVIALLAGLLSGGRDLDDLGAATSEIVADEFPGLSEMFSDLLPGRLADSIDRLVTLGVVELHDVETVTCADCGGTHRVGGRVELTPSGTAIMVELARENGLDVVERPDPTRASAGEMVDLIGVVDEQDWARELDDWFAARPDPAAATVELVDATTAADRETVVVIAGLEAAARLGGNGAVDAVRAHLEGPWDGLVLNWLLTRSAIDPAGIEPSRLVRGLVDFLAAALDTGGPAELVSVFDDASSRDQVELLGSVWRLEHPRLPDVLDALGSAHPVKTVAKAARKSLAKHRSMLAERRSQGAGAARR